MTNLDALFDISTQTRAKMPKSIMVPIGIDTHVHGRTPTDGRSQMVMHACAGEFEAIVDIPNVPNVSTGNECLARRTMLESYVPEPFKLRVYETPLINDHTDYDMLRHSWDQAVPSLQGVKIFWEGVSNAYGQYITSVEAIGPLLRSATRGLHHQKEPWRVSIHAECLKSYAGAVIPIKDREFWCVEHEVARMIVTNPGGIYIIRHVSDYRTLQFIQYHWNRGVRIYGEVSPQYLILIDDDLFTDDKGHAELQCDCVFWPRPKDQRSRKAIQDTVRNCPPWLVYGSDFAMHLHDQSQDGGVKINKWGKAVGGLNFLPSVAKSVLIDFCVSHGKPEVLRKLLVDNPSAAYGIQLLGTEVKYIREDWRVQDFTSGKNAKSEPVRALNFLRGHIMHWQRAD